MLLAAIFLALSPKTIPQDALAAGFLNPPASAKPHTWWHWMDGNVTKEGITADLEAMRQVGIGGAQMFTVSQGIPPGPVGYMSDRWREMTAHAVREAGRLGIELCIHNCAGWSSSGGPWITPENAMQVIAWSEVRVHGPAHFSDRLPQPKAPQVYTNVPYYKDIAVFAYRTPSEGDVGKPDPHFLGRTGVVREDGLEPDLSPEPAGMALPMRDIVVLTDRLDSEGRLVWDAPAGDWTILRMGHVPTGKDNHPAPPEGDGLEVDKLSREALDAHWAGMMAKVIADAGPLAGKVLNNSLIDSYEVGSQNWTPRFREEFQKRRGYDPLPYLPVIAGRTIESREVSERFLWDMRRTIADLYADNYYGYFGELCHRAGMKFSTEPYGNGGFDNIQSGGKADIPMGEFWVGGGTLETTKLASSVGHVYGRPVIGAESFTADDVRGRWLEEPYSAKALGDLVFCNGINRYIFHRYAHQPWMNLYPGMTMGPWGTHLERTQTWWTEAATWLKYVARCQYLLQKGKFVADALYFYGEGAPADLPYRPGLKPRLPAGYDYDGCDATTVMERLRVDKGRLVLPDGMSYRVLVLPESRFMTPGMASRLRDLVDQGAVVVGPKPLKSPSLVGYPGCDTELRRTADELWGTDDSLKERVLGQGRMISGKSLDEVFTELKVAPDFQYRSTSGGSKLVDIHRNIEGVDVYFVSNQQYQPTEADCIFRVSGKAPELWHADSGLIEEAPVFRDEKGRTVVPLRLGPAESVFVVFRHAPTGDHLAFFGPSGIKRSPPRPPVVVIKSARYESEDGRGADVTETVTQMVREGQLEIPASNGVFGDPVINVVKHLRIDYVLNGKSMTKTVAENETLSLLDASGPAMQPVAFALGLTGTTLTLVPWKAGTYNGITARGRNISVLIKEKPPLLAIAGPWRVTFPPNWGAPPSIEMAKLISWTENADKGVRYFSGSATYSHDLIVSPSMLGNDRAVVLDLGKVKNFATVRLNRTEIGVLWKEPFRLDVSRALRPGRNKLEIKVTNLWPNRLIGDEQLPPDAEWHGATLNGWPEWLKNGQPRPKTGRFTFTTWHFYNKDSKLPESGLLGPVVLRSARKVVVRLQ